MSEKQKILLASASPARLELLKNIGIAPDKIEAADIDETPLKAELPQKMVARLSLEKALKLHKKYPDFFIIAADTTAARGRRIIGKAENPEEAKKYIKLLSGCRHRVYTGVAVINPAGKILKKTVMTALKFKRLNSQEIENYIATNEWVGKAGCFTLNGSAGKFIEWINGSYSSVIGLPLCEAVNMLENLGYKNHQS